LYAYFKWDRRTNYKSNMINTLGRWELPSVFSLEHGALAVIACVQAGSSPAEAKKAVDDFLIRIEIVRKVSEEEKVGSRKDI
jgi:hypothetical protein